MRHIALLGDSVFDNAAYTQGQPDVAAHLRALLPQPSTVTLCAVDGSTTFDVGDQLDQVPAAATDLILSLGGNDALLNADLLDLPVRSTGEALDLFRDRAGSFAESYRHAIEALLGLARPLTVCTIYHGKLASPEAERAPVALAIFNDVIVRTALRFGLPVIDLRSVCTEPDDFANPIEPSGAGGLKIATAILRALGPAEPGPGRAAVRGHERVRGEGASGHGALMKTPISDPIAAVALVVTRPGHASIPITVEIGRPYVAGELEARCPVCLRGFEPQYPDMTGETTLQALCLALSLVRTRLEHAMDEGCVLTDSDGVERYQRSDIAALFSRVGG